MSILKIMYTQGNQVLSMRDVITDIIDPVKTKYEYISSYLGPHRFSGFSNFNAFFEMNIQFREPATAKVYDHYMIRLDATQDKDTATELIYTAMNDLLRCFCLHMGGTYAGLMSLHFDTSLPHAHFLIDSKDIKTGHRRRTKKKNLCKMRREISTILSFYTLSPLEESATSSNPC